MGESWGVGCELRRAFAVSEQTELACAIEASALTIDR